MKFLSIAGPKADIDRIARDYLSKYEIYLENALTELQGVKDLRPYIEINPYKEVLVKAKELLGLIDTSQIISQKELNLEESIDAITSLSNSIESLKMEKSTLEKEREVLRESLLKIKPFIEFHYDIASILHFQFIRFRFGKIPVDNFKKFKSYVYDDLDTLFYECHHDDNYVWGIYFVPITKKEKVDAVYSSLHFERTFLPDEYEGTPDEAYSNLEDQISHLNTEIDAINAQATAKLFDSREILVSAYNYIESLSRNFDIRKMAACTKEYHEVFYILCGWMSWEDAEAFQEDIKNDDKLFVIIQDDQNEVLSNPPTKLKNPKLFKPFESFVRMYGLPSYNEIDPTVFLGLTYPLIFGAMFGDVGQGLLLVLLGAILYVKKKVDLFAIISIAGVFSTIFGFLYGSFFGFEDIIPAIWLRPMEHSMTLPVVGTLNTVLVVSVGFGMLLILLSMLFNIINGIKQGNIEKIFFDTNGLSGFVFYGAIVAVVFLLMSGHTISGGIALILLFVIPLCLIAFKEPISKLIEKKADAMPKEKGMFLVQSFFELFEVVLSYMTNTISFVRIGAFALSHAGMMQVVLMLAGAENGGTPNWLVIILGNLFVMGMEGLIVGIHVLRLEYYEMFSRFFSGNGREFKSFTQISNK